MSRTYWITRTWKVRRFRLAQPGRSFICMTIQVHICKSYFKRKAEKLKFHLIAIGIAINLRDGQNVSEQLALKVKSKCTLRDRLRVVPHFSSGIVENLITSHDWKATRRPVAFSRVRWFSRALAFRSLYYPWGKMGTTRSLPARRGFWLAWLLALGQVWKNQLCDWQATRTTL